MKKQLIFAVAIASAMLTMQNPALAQGDAAKLLQAGTADGNALLNAYMGPMFKGFASGLNAGWYNTAKPHGTGGFDITFSLGAFGVPDDGKNFNLSEAGVGKTGSFEFRPDATSTPPTDANTQNPTIFGTDKEGGRYDMWFHTSYNHPVLGNRDTAVYMDKFQLPQGTNVNMFPYLPNAQLAIGIYKNTEVMIRFLPKMKAGDFSAGIFGLGVKHDIKQWIPGIKDQKMWDWSGVFGFNTFSADYAFAEKDALTTEGSTASNAATYAGKTNENYWKQGLSFTGSGWMLGTVVSAKLLFFTPYLGISFNSAKTEFQLKGRYPYEVAEFNGTTQSKKIHETPEDPITIEGKVSGLRINPGFRLKLLVLTLGYDYSINTYGYNLHTVGVGLNLQSIYPFKL